MAVGRKKQMSSTCFNWTFVALTIHCNLMYLGRWYCSALPEIHTRRALPCGFVQIFRDKYSRFLFAPGIGTSNYRGY